MNWGELYREGSTRLKVVVLLLSMMSTMAQAQIGQRNKEGDPRVRRILEQADLKFDVDDDGDFKLGNRMDDNRTQMAWINSNTSRFVELEIRNVWSIGYISKEPLNLEVTTKLLEQNRRVKLGAWHIQKAGESNVAIFQAQIAADADKLTLLQVLQAVTSTADDMEKELMDGKDPF